MPTMQIFPILLGAMQSEKVSSNQGVRNNPLRVDRQRKSYAQDDLQYIFKQQIQINKGLVTKNQIIMKKTKEKKENGMLSVLDSIQIYGGISDVDSNSNNRNCTYLKVCTTD